MNYETNKILGGIGAILMFLGAIPFVSYYGIVELVGVILVLVALYGLSGHFHDSSIIKNAVIGIVAMIIGVAVSVAVALSVIWGNISAFIYEIYPQWDGNWGSLQGLTPDPNQFAGDFDISTLIPIIVGILSIMVIIWIAAIIGSFFFRRSLKQVSARSGIGLFGTAGTVMLVGAFLIILLGLGLILMWIATLLLAIAFFQLKPAVPAQLIYPPPAQTPP